MHAIHVHREVHSRRRNRDFVHRVCAHRVATNIAADKDFDSTLLVTVNPAVTHKVFPLEVPHLGAGVDLRLALPAALVARAVRVALPADIPAAVVAALLTRTVGLAFGDAVVEDIADVASLARAAGSAALVIPAALAIALRNAGRRLNVGVATAADRAEQAGEADDDEQESERSDADVALRAYCCTPFPPIWRTNFTAKMADWL